MFNKNEIQQKEYYSNVVISNEFIFVNLIKIYIKLSFGPSSFRHII